MPKEVIDLQDCYDAKLDLDRQWFDMEQHIEDGLNIKDILDLIHKSRTLVGTQTGSMIYINSPITTPEALTFFQTKIVEYRVISRLRGSSSKELAREAERDARRIPVCVQAIQFLAAT